MGSTEELIASLAISARPVRPLRPPALRALLWIAGAFCLVALVMAVRGLRPDIAAQLATPTFQLMIIGALATSGLAAVASFHLSLPDRSRRWLLLPLPAALLWLSSIGYGCLVDWVRAGQDDVTIGRVLDCLLTVLVAGLPLGAALAVMVRHAAWLDSAPVATSGALAVAALVAATLSLVHPLDATVMILIWHVGLAAIACALAGRYGRVMLDAPFLRERWQGGRHSEIGST